MNMASLCIMVRNARAECSSCENIRGEKKDAAETLGCVDTRFDVTLILKV